MIHRLPVMADSLLWLLHLLLPARRGVTDCLRSLLPTGEEARDSGGAMLGRNLLLGRGLHRALKLRKMDVRRWLLVVCLMLLKHLFFFLLCKHFLEELFLVERIARARPSREPMLSISSVDQVLLARLTCIEWLSGNRLRRELFFSLV